jgi:phosphatidylglycerophosphate synthase
MSNPTFTLSDVRELTYKRRDSWWTVFLVDPVASHLVKVTANRTSITPNQLTIAALLLGLGAAVCFAQGTSAWLLAGAALFHLGFVLDCMDGKIARLKGTGSAFGAWLDYVFDRIRVLICALCLLGGFFLATGESVFLWSALLVVFTDMFRYLNSPQMAKVRKNLKSGVRKRVALALPAVGQEELAQLLGARRFEEVRPRWFEETEADGDAHQPSDRDGVDDEADHATAAAPVGSLADRFPAYARFRDFLERHRIRSHLFSGIEFQMGTFIVAPVVGAFSVPAMLVVIITSCVTMLVTELFLIVRLWQYSRRVERETALLDTVIPLDAEMAGTAG